MDGWMDGLNNLNTLFNHGNFVKFTCKITKILVYPKAVLIG